VIDKNEAPGPVRVFHFFNRIRFSSKAGLVTIDFHVFLTRDLSHLCAAAIPIPKILSTPTFFSEIDFSLSF